ncbi:MAG TPA: hypothetical protein PKA57_13595 [Parvibaculum sp.]|nr:hypothetical protein [Parvibaculum sp.]
MIDVTPSVGKPDPTRANAGCDREGRPERMGGVGIRDIHIRVGFRARGDRTLVHDVAIDGRHVGEHAAGESLGRSRLIRRMRDDHARFVIDDVAADFTTVDHENASSRIHARGLDLAAVLDIARNGAFIAHENADSGIG